MSRAIREGGSSKLAGGKMHTLHGNQKYWIICTKQATVFYAEQWWVGVAFRMKSLKKGEIGKFFMITLSNNTFVY